MYTPTKALNLSPISTQKNFKKREKNFLKNAGKTELFVLSRPGRVTAAYSERCVTYPHYNCKQFVVSTVNTGKHSPTCPAARRPVKRQNSFAATLL